MNYIRAKYIDFCTFLCIDFPLFTTRVAAALPPAVIAERAVLFILAVALPLIWWTR